LFLTISVFCRQTAYDKKQEKRKHDREAVAAGTATDEQWNSGTAFICLKCRSSARNSSHE
jgi:hypothetical protein